MTCGDPYSAFNPSKWTHTRSSRGVGAHTPGAVGARGAVGRSVHTHSRSSGRAGSSRAFGAHTHPEQWRAGSSRGFGAHTHPEQWARGEQSGVRCTHTAGAVGARGAVGHSVHTHTRSSGHAGSSRGFGATHTGAVGAREQWGFGAHTPGAVGARGAVGGSVHTHTRSSGHAGSRRGFGTHTPGAVGAREAVGGSVLNLTSVVVLKDVRYSLPPHSTIPAGPEI